MLERGGKLSEIKSEKESDTGNTTPHNLNSKFESVADSGAKSSIFFTPATSAAKLKRTPSESENKQ